MPIDTSYNATSSTPVSKPQSQQVELKSSNDIGREIKPKLQSPVPNEVKADAATIAQLATNNSAPASNSSGIGQKAVSSYQSLAMSENAAQISEKVKVNIQA